MKLKKGFELRDICGEKVIIATGIENVDFNQMIALNETAAELWKAVEGIDFDANTLAQLLCNDYEVSQEQALADSQALINDWKQQGIVED